MILMDGLVGRGKPLAWHTRIASLVAISQDPFPGKTSTFPTWNSSSAFAVHWSASAGSRRLVPPFVSGPSQYTESPMMLSGKLCHSVSCHSTGGAGISNRARYPCGSPNTTLMLSK